MAKNGDECVSTSYSQLSHFAMSHYFRAMLAPLLLLLLLFCFIHYQLVRCDAGNFSEPNELPSTRLSVYSLYMAVIVRCIRCRSTLFVWATMATMATITTITNVQHVVRIIQGFFLFLSFRQIAKRFSTIILVLKLNGGITVNDYSALIHSHGSAHTFLFDSTYMRLKLGFLNCFFAILSMNKKACITSS